MFLISHPKCLIGELTASKKTALRFNKIAPLTLLSSRVSLS